VRANTGELSALFSGLGATRISEIVTWFTGDKCNLKIGWGFVDNAEKLPSVSIILPTDTNSQEIIGDFESEKNPDSDFSNQNYVKIFQFQRRIQMIVRDDNPATANYLYEIVKYIMLTLKKTLVETYNLETMTFSGGFNGSAQNKAGVWIHQYFFNLDYMFETAFVETDDAQQILDNSITGTYYIQELHDVPVTDVRKE